MQWTVVRFHSTSTPRWSRLIAIVIAARWIPAEGGFLRKAKDAVTP
jgi:hypothetical protein